MAERSAWREQVEDAAEGDFVEVGGDEQGDSGWKAELQRCGFRGAARIDHGELGEGRVGQWSGVAAAAARPVEAVRGDVVLARKLGYGETGRLEGGDDAVRFVMRPRRARVGHPNRFAGFNHGLGWVGRTCTTRLDAN